MLLVAPVSAQARAIPKICEDAHAQRLCAIHHYRKETNEYRSRLGLRPLPYRWLAERYPARRDRILHYWHHAERRAAKRWHKYLASPMAWFYSSGASCVHHYEGPWNANTGNGYYGGFQMDLRFQEAHGAQYLARYGTANNWPVIDQIIVTRKVVGDSGWGQWPNTAAKCGLL